MFAKLANLAAVYSWFPIALALVLVLSGFGSPFPSMRSAELEESSQCKCQHEELSLVRRAHSQRELQSEARALSTSLAAISAHPLGRAQSPVLSASGGHRLPNGLLAPLTC